MSDSRKKDQKSNVEERKIPVQEIKEREVKIKEDEAPKKIKEVKEREIKIAGHVLKPLIFNTSCDALLRQKGVNSFCIRTSASGYLENITVDIYADWGLPNGQSERTIYSFKLALIPKGETYQEQSGWVLVRSQKKQDEIHRLWDNKKISNERCVGQLLEAAPLLFKAIENTRFGADAHFAGVSIRIGENQLLPNPEQEVKEAPYSGQYYYQIKRLSHSCVFKDEKTLNQQLVFEKCWGLRKASLPGFLVLVSKKNGRINQSRLGYIPPTANAQLIERLGKGWCELGASHSEEVERELARLYPDVQTRSAVIQADKDALFHYLQRKGFSRRNQVNPMPEQSLSEDSVEVREAWPFDGNDFAVQLNFLSSQELLALVPLPPPKQQKQDVVVDDKKNNMSPPRPLVEEQLLEDEEPRSISLPYSSIFVDIC
jgi:hypothetical protein